MFHTRPARWASVVSLHPKLWANVTWVRTKDSTHDSRNFPPGHSLTRNDRDTRPVALRLHCCPSLCSVSGTSGETLSHEDTPTPTSVLRHTSAVTLPEQEARWMWCGRVSPGWGLLQKGGTTRFLYKSALAASCPFLTHMTRVQNRNGRCYIMHRGIYALKPQLSETTSFPRLGTPFWLTQTYTVFSGAN